MTRQPWETIGPPPLGLFALDQGRAALDLIQLRRRRQLARTARAGDGHPVLVLPGLLAGDLSTVPLRRFLRQTHFQDTQAPLEVGARAVLAHVNPRRILDD